MKAIFVTGTAGSGKSLLTSKLIQWYKDSQAFPIALNLDPGAINLPYEPDVDVRDYIDINTIMESYGLGPNGSLIMASDMIATRIDEVQNEVDSLNPDYVIVDTPGQVELFAFRASGPYFVTNFQSDSKVTLFAFDGMVVSSPVNYVSVAMLAASVRLRLKTSQVNVLTKRDLIIDKLKDIIKWSASTTALTMDLEKEKETESALLSKEIIHSMAKAGFIQGLIAVSSVTMSGMINLAATLSRIIDQGEEIKD
jgi:GTPase SAR1 family protein